MGVIHMCVHACESASLSVTLYMYRSIQTITWSQKLYEFLVLGIILILARCV